MGIRAALGASGGELVRLVLAETGRLVMFGLAAGLTLVWMGASTIRSFLFGVQPLDPGTLGAVAILILMLAMTVSLRPALRASRVDLATVLREE
jgi:ABC-type antimicrobial peptide transport system permease subunit